MKLTGSVSLPLMAEDDPAQIFMRIAECYTSGPFYASFHLHSIQASTYIFFIFPFAPVSHPNTLHSIALTHNIKSIIIKKSDTRSCPQHHLLHEVSPSSIDSHRSQIFSRTFSLTMHDNISSQMAKVYNASCLIYIHHRFYARPQWLCLFLADSRTS